MAEESRQGLYILLIVAIVSVVAVVVLLIESSSNGSNGYYSNSASLDSSGQANGVTGYGIKESVKCVFNGASKPQSCTSSQGALCTGISTCLTSESGLRGTKVTWKSSCGGYAYTTIDGTSKYANFLCVPCSPPICPPLPTGCTYTNVSYDSTGCQRTCGIPLCPTQLKESVMCVFNGATTAQSCKSSKGTSCIGIGSCQTSESGFKGEQVSWQSSCSNGITYLTVDGFTKKAVFTCASQPAITVSTDKTSYNVGDAMLISYKASSSVANYMRCITLEYNGKMIGYVTQDNLVLGTSGIIRYVIPKEYSSLPKGIWTAVVSSQPDCGAWSQAARSPGFTIIPSTCIPSCIGKQCGSNGCDGVCGACTSDYKCDTNGQCIQANCIPMCDPQTQYCDLTTLQCVSYTNICTPGTIQPGTNCLLCNNAGSAYVTMSAWCQKYYPATPFCNNYGKCVVASAYGS